MEHVARVFSGFQTHSGRFRTETVLDEAARLGRVLDRSLQGGSRQNLSNSNWCGASLYFCRCGAGADKQFQPAQDSSTLAKLKKVYKSSC